MESFLKVDTLSGQISGSLVKESKKLKCASKNTGLKLFPCNVVVMESNKDAQSAATDVGNRCTTFSCWSNNNVTLLYILRSS